jgi:hypothetical protein
MEIGPACPVDPCVPEDRGSRLSSGYERTFKDRRVPRDQEDGVRLSQTILVRDRSGNGLRIIRPIENHPPGKLPEDKSSGLPAPRPPKYVPGTATRLMNDNITDVVCHDSQKDRHS